MSTSQSNDDDILAAARDGFLDEAREMLRQFESGLLSLEASPDDAEVLNAAFRAAHTIKGTAGLFGYASVVAFTHEVEAVLEAMRAGERRVDEAAIALLLQSRDQIEALLNDVAHGTSETAVAEHSVSLGAQLRELLGRAPAPQPAFAALAAYAAEASHAGVAGGWHIDVRFSRDALRHGLDPLSFIRYLSTRGTLAGMRLLCEELPDLQHLDPESCYLGFQADFLSPCERTLVEEAFEFAIDECELHITPLTTAAAPARTPPGAATVPTSPGALEGQSELAEALPELPLAERRGNTVDRRQAARRGDDTRFIRVQADKLDKLIDLIGELVIASSGAQLAAQEENFSASSEAALRISDLVEQARDGALSLRMVPIGETFARFQRVVRDVSKSLSKDVELVITGGETELDKSMVETIADPLMHLVRNSLDHGIEAPEVRAAAGKPARGVLALNAYHEAGQIIIEVSDDGGGLNRERILAKAIERGLVRADQALSSSEVDQLICLPGFSTKEQVTDLSGRGVGMDVVKRSIEALRGQMHIASEYTRGMTTQIRLPLTLAIIDGFLTQVSGVSYVVPLEIVAECIDLPDECRQNPERVSGYFDLRGEVLPYLDVARFYQRRAMAGEAARAGSRRSLVVVRDGPTRIGLIVDRLLGEHQTVIKPLSGIFRNLRAIAGSTILGSGEVALVLDVPALVGYAMQRSAALRAPAAGSAVSARGADGARQLASEATR